VSLGEPRACQPAACGPSDDGPGEGVCGAGEPVAVEHLSNAVWWPGDVRELGGGGGEAGL